MNKAFKKMALATLITASAFAASMANATESDPTNLTLTVSGSIDAAPCNVLLNKTSLDLGSPLISDLKTSSEDPSETYAKTLQVAITDCDSINAAIDVIGTADNTDSSILANTAAENASTNVGVAVWSKIDDTSTQYKIGGDSIKTSKGVNDLQFAIVKVSDTATVTEGDVVATAQVKVSFL